MITNTLISKVFDMTPQGIGKWKKEKRPIIELIEKYFIKEDLEEFLENGRIKRFEKTNVSNIHLILLSEEFTLYILKNNGVKALLTTLKHEKNITFRNLNTSIFKQYDEKRISQQDIIDYLNNPPSITLKYFILENSYENWELYLSSLTPNLGWIKTYMEILDLSIEKGLYNLIVNSHLGYKAIPNIELLYSDYLDSTKRVIYRANQKPKHRKIDSLFKSDEFVKFNKLLLELKELLVDDRYEEIYMYNEKESFHNNIKPALFEGRNNEGEKLCQLKDVLTQIDYYKFLDTQLNDGNK